MRKRKRVEFESVGEYGKRKEKGWQFDPHITFYLIEIDLEGGRWYSATHLPTGMAFPIDVKGLRDADWVSSEISKLVDWEKITSLGDFLALPAETQKMIKKEVESFDMTLEMQYSGKV